MLEFVNKYAGNVKYSQNGEEKLLIECLQRMRISDGVAVEIGGSDGFYCSNIALLLEDGWSGMFVETDYRLWQQCRDNWKHNPKVKCVCSHVTERNVAAFVDSSCVVLSLDTDGGDFRIFEALSVKPSIVVIEIDSSIPPDVDGFNADGGAGFKPMVELGMSKGYRLLCHTGNLIFIDKQFKHLFPETLGRHPIIESELYFNRGWLKEDAA